MFTNCIVTQATETAANEMKSFRYSKSNFSAIPDALKSAKNYINYWRIQIRSATSCNLLRWLRLR